MFLKIVLLYFALALAVVIVAGWSDWSPCSEECGGGIQRREKSRSAEEEIRVCNRESCGSGGSMREKQCARFNQRVFRNNIKYNWLPMRGTAERRCDLLCQSEDGRTKARLAKKVMNGTTCGADAVCYKGICMRYGCDEILGSENTIDTCGICGGDGSTCKLFSGIYARSEVFQALHEVIIIPRGARLINITDLKYTSNYYVLQTYDGTRTILDGQQQGSNHRNYGGVGTIWEYTKSHGNKYQTLTANGPISQSVRFLIRSKEPNPGIIYQFLRPAGAGSEPLPPNRQPSLRQTSRQVTDVVTESSRNYYTTNDNSIRRPSNVGGGIDIGYAVDDDQRYLTNDVQPAYQTPAKFAYATGRLESSVVPAGGVDQSRSSVNQFVWKVTGFTKCNRDCAGGTQKTIILCVQLSNEAVVTEDNCDLRRKPVEKTVQCNQQPCKAPEWTISSNWSTCSTTCGKGIQLREVECLHRFTPTEAIKVPAHKCNKLKKPEFRRICRVIGCGHWAIGAWGKCSSKCGTGVVTRTVRCVDEMSNDISETQCDGNKPPETDACDNGYSNCWLYSQWSDQCSSDCGAGVYSRSVFCPSATDTSPGYCAATDRPRSTAPCLTNNRRVCGGQWFTGAWSKCTSKCSGVRHRQVICMKLVDNKYWAAVSDSYCIKEEKPDEEKVCESGQCNSMWFLTHWSECSVTCGEGFQTRLVKCLDENFSASVNCETETRPKDKLVCSMPPCNRNASNGNVCEDKSKTCYLVQRNQKLCEQMYWREPCCSSCLNYQHHQ